MLLMLRPFDRIKIDTFFIHFPDRTKVSHMVYTIGYLFDRLVYFFFCSKSAQAESDRRMCQVITKP